MTKIEKKIWPEYFSAILEGKKTFELRLNDFAIEAGDTLLLREWDPATQKYTGREIEKEVGYVLPFTATDLEKFYSKTEIDDKGLQVISLL